MTTSAEASVGTELAETDDRAISLVEIEPGLAVLFADHVPVGLDVVPFEMTTTRARAQLTDRLAVASGLGNLAAQGIQAATNVQGLVRLAPETLQALQTAQPMVSGGWNLGSLVDGSGKIAASVRWAPATGVQSVTMIAALGPAAAMLAMQVQLASISRRIDENIELTRDVLHALHEDQWTTLLGLHETTMRAVREARIAGIVNDHIFAAVSTREADLRKQQHLFLSFVQRHIAALDADASSRRAYIEKYVEQIIADTHGLLMAEGSWYRSQVLRAARIAGDDAHSVENEKLLADLVEVTEREHTRDLETIANLLGVLERQCRLMAELPAERSLPFTGKRRSIRDTVAMSEALADLVASLRNRVNVRPPVADPSLAVFKEPVPEDVLRILRWAVPGQSDLLAIADVNLDRLVGDNAYLGVTPERLFISSQSAVRKQGVIERDVPLTDIRYVRFREREKQGPVLDVITADENIRLTFDSWAATGDGLDVARRLGNLLASTMDIPESERRTDPLLPAKEPEALAIAQ
ncbi:hypothetical protein [Agromyces sp. Marseille-Q5079]|uniref:hypothetical protein n=1 Tax=Agromyces sp. Marseille-Q5079 TaxID=3439059 RepID=UPI003D9C9062